MIRIKPAQLEPILQRKFYKARIAFIFLLLVLLISLLASIRMGRADIAVIDVIKIIAAKISSKSCLLAGINAGQVAIIADIRLPRIMTAVIVGAGLAVSGAVFQSLLMNPLADSYTMGVSSGAAFGATVAIYLNMFILSFTLPVTLCAFIGAMLTLALVTGITRAKGEFSSANLVLAGIIVSCIFSAAISFVKNAAAENVAAIVGWLMGSLAARSWEHVVLGFSVITVCTIICIYFADDLNILCLGEKESRALGIDAQKLRKLLLVCGSLITAVCVSISGIIGFIGLVVPHMLRMALGSDNRIVIPLSALLGGELLLLADTTTRALLR